MRHNKKGHKLGTDYSHTKGYEAQWFRPVPERPHQDGGRSRAKEIRPQVDTR